MHSSASLHKHWWYIFVAVHIIATIVDNANATIPIYFNNCRSLIATTTVVQPLHPMRSLKSLQPVLQPLESLQPLQSLQSNAVIEIIATITAATGVIATPAIIAIKLIHEVINKKPKKEPNSFSHLHC